MQPHSKKSDLFESSQIRHFWITFGLILFSVFFAACQPMPEADDNSSLGETAESALITPTPKEDISDFDRELKSMRMAGFDYIFTLKRKDDTAFTSEDKAFVRDNKHYAANRFTFIEDERTLFIGSNYEFKEASLAALRERFEFQDFSKPKAQIEKERREAEETENPNPANDNSADDNGNSANGVSK